MSAWGWTAVVAALILTYDAKQLFDYDEPVAAMLCVFLAGCALFTV
jgi:hypothetical protein